MILITGASSGIGKSCAEIFAKNGNSLFLMARRKERLLEIKKNLEKTCKVQVHTATLDIRNKTEIRNVFKKNELVLAKTTVLINNAGLARGLDPIQNGRTEDWDLMIDTNIKGLLYITNATLPIFLKNKSGHIINLGSVAGYFSYPKGNIYCATKAALRSLNESMRQDLNGSGIRVTEIAPGMVETEFSEIRLKSKSKAKKVYEAMTPLVAEDIAKIIHWTTTQPKHVNIQSLLVYPTDQASPTLVHRRF